MQVTGLDVDLDGIAVIDGLPTGDRATYQDTQKLIDLIKSIEPSFLGPHFECNSRSEYVQALESLTKAAGEGRKYLLHFECHGSRVGVEMGSDLVAWRAQAPLLSKLNASMGKQLVIDLSACNGIHSSRIAGLGTSPPPFYGVIGPAKTVAMKCASVITAAFYRAYLQDHAGQLDQAIAAANRNLQYPAILGLRAEAFERLSQQGHPFRPNADDDEILDCRGDGTLFVIK